MSNHKMVSCLFLAGLVTLLTLAGCGSDPKTLSFHQDSLSYEMDINGCYYKSPVYESTDDYCRALQNSSLNVDARTGQECGRDYRHTLFDKNCDGNW